MPEIRVPRTENRRPKFDPGNSILKRLFHASFQWPFLSVSEVDFWARFSAFQASFSLPFPAQFARWIPATDFVIGCRIDFRARFSTFQALVLLWFFASEIASDFGIAFLFSSVD